MMVVRLLGAFGRCLLALLRHSKCLHISLTVGHGPHRDHAQRAASPARQEPEVQPGYG